MQGTALTPWEHLCHLGTPTAATGTLAEDSPATLGTPKATLQTVPPALGTLCCHSGDTNCNLGTPTDTLGTPPATQGSHTIPLGTLQSL